MIAQDHDTGNNARLTYRLRPENGSEQVFGVFPNSGLIYLKQRLDREVKDRYVVIIGASDNGTPADTATARVVVTVVDANDNDPRFTKEIYEFTVEENLPVGSFVGKIAAVDPDLGNNALVRFSFIPGNSTFRINPSTGMHIFTIFFSYFCSSALNCSSKSDKNQECSTWRAIYLILYFYRKFPNFFKFLPTISGFFFREKRGLVSSSKFGHIGFSNN